MEAGGWPVIHNPDDASTWRVYCNREIKRQRDRKRDTEGGSRGTHLMGGEGEKKERGV